VRDRALALATFLAVAVTVFIVYGRAIDAPFIFDDLPGIVKNPSIVRLWPPIGDSTHRGPLNAPPLVATARRPLPNLTLALNYRFGGLRPEGYHVFNLVMHALSAAMLAALVRRTLRLPYFAGAWDDAAWPLSVAVALVWAVHPLDTEAVAYVTQRTELLVALFYLTTLWAAVRYWTAAGRPARAFWVAVAASASLAGMASKEIMVSVPLVVLLYERTFLRRSFREAWDSWPLYAGLTLGWPLLVLLSASGVGGLSDPRHQVPLLVWWMTQAKVLLVYLKLVVWPWPLSIHYAPVYLRTFAEAWPWIAAVATLAAVALALLWRRPAARVVAAAIVLLLAPTLLVPLPKMMAAERRLYLPLAGVVTLAIVGGYGAVAGRWPSASRRLSAVATALLLLGFSVVTVRRLAVYETPVTIWRDAVLHQPADPMAHYNLGVALVEEGRPPDEAIVHFEDTLRLDPEHTGALDNLGMLLNRLGRPEEAMRRFQHALQIEPGDAVAHNNLGAALVTLGRPEEAIPHLNQALRLDPDGSKSKVHLNLGRALMDTGHTEDAIAHLEEAVRLQSDDADARYSLGVMLTNAGRPGDAIAHLEQALRLEPDDPEAYNALGSAELRLGHLYGAVGYYQQALELRPDYAEAHNNLGAVLLDLGKPGAAIEEFQQALRLKPDNANAHFNLANVLLKSGRPADAIEHFEQALRLGANDAQTRFACAMAYVRNDEPSKARPMAEAALALARAQGDAHLADEIDAWLRAPGHLRR
jgi:tetratricopeptide (TPR) repeat protein